MAKKILSSLAVAIVGGFLLLMMIGIISTQKACSLDTVQSVVNKNIKQKLDEEVNVANIGGALLSKLGKLVGKGNAQRPELSYQYKISSVTTVSSNLREASCTALVDVAVNINNENISSDTHQIRYTMRKDDRDNWIIYVDTSGLDD